MISAIGKGGNPDVMAGVSEVCVNVKLKGTLTSILGNTLKSQKSPSFTCDEKLKIMVQFCLKSLYQCSEL